MEDVPCLICGSPRSEVFRRAPDWTRERSDLYRFDRCAGCGLIYQRPRPTRQTISSAYPDTYLPFQQTRDSRRSWLRRLDARHGLAKRRRYVERWATGGRLLDVGCGSGDFLAAMARAGWTAVGLDVAHAVVRACVAAHALPAVEAVADLSMPFRAEAFDVITYWDVLEHLHDPRRALAEARRLVRPGGTLVVTVPDAASFQARLFGPYWQGFDAPRHLSMFTRPTLARLLAETGWTVAEVSTFTGATRTFLLSLGWWLKGALGPRWGGRAAGFVGSRAGRVLLTLPLVALAKCGGTSHVTVVARPTTLDRPAERPNRQDAKNAKASGLMVSGLWLGRLT
ncbi:MAG: class I SAM-dependent methyltransferase [Chloroflexi bacterium]|nr:class I SAM-dependent methyltransferase [Chloroflexota bacterium]